MAKTGSRHRGLKIFVAIIVALVVLHLIWDWNWFRGLAAARASAVVGRKVEVGHLDARLLRLHPWIAWDDTTIANPDELADKEPVMFSVKRFSVRWDLLALLHKRAFVEEIWVQNPKGDFKPGPSGKANYLIDPPKPDAREQEATAAKEPSQVPPPERPKAVLWTFEIASLVIREGDIHFVDPKFKSDFRLKTYTDLPRADGKAPDIHVDIKGTYAAQPIDGRFIGSSVLTLRDPSNPYHVDLKLANGNTKVSLDGTLLRPTEFAGANLKLVFTGDNLADLYPLTGVPLPQTAAFRLAGQLDYAKPNIRFKDFTGTVGNSDLNGSFFVEPRKPRLRVTADLFSRQVDLKDLGGLVGAPAGEQGDAKESEEAKAQRARNAARGKVLPDEPLNFPKLNAADLDVKYKAGHIQGERMPIDDLSFALTIVDGVVAVKPLAFGIGDGRIAVDLDLDARKPPAALKAKIDFRKVSLASLMKTTGVFKGQGSIGGHAVLDAKGDTVAQMLGGGDGELKLFATGGDLSALLVDLAGLDIGNGILSLIGIPSRAQLRCFVADLGLTKGAVDTKILLVDTTEANLVGEGKISLADETLDYVLKTEPKNLNIGSVATPIHIRGTLASPAIRPEVLPLAARTGAAVALGILATPLAAIIPTIQLGLGEDNDCKSLLDDLKANQVSAKQAKRTPPPQRRKDNKKSAARPDAEE